MSMYSHDTTYKNLVIAGAKLVKDLKALDKADMEAVDEVYEDGYNIYDAIKLLANIAADLTTEARFYYDIAQIYYADTISVYAYNKELGEKYFDLLWKMNEGDEEAKAAFEELSKMIPDDEHYWVRRNT